MVECYKEKTLYEMDEYDRIEESKQVPIGFLRLKIKGTYEYEMGLPEKVMGANTRESDSGEFDKEFVVPVSFLYPFIKLIAEDAVSIFDY